MSQFNKFYSELRTIDYGLLCVDLYHLPELPIEVKIPEPEEREKWDSGHEPGSKEEWKAFVDLVESIPVKGLIGILDEIPPVEPVKIEVELDWGKAKWVRYNKTTFWADMKDKFNENWIWQTPGPDQYLEPLSEIVTLPQDKIEVHLRQLAVLAVKLGNCLDVFWDKVGREPKKRFYNVESEPWRYRLQRFNWFHHVISHEFITTNFPFPSEDNKLYFGRAFLERCEGLTSKKILLIGNFIQEVRELTSTYEPKNTVTTSAGPTLDSEEDTSKTDTKQTDDKWKGRYTIPIPQLSLVVVRNFFMQLAEPNNKNNRPFLSADGVDRFIGSAFAGEPFIGKLTLNEDKGSKRDLIGLFHRLYEYCSVHQSGSGKPDPDANTTKYARLLTDNFDNWPFEGKGGVKDNFRKAGNWKSPEKDK